MSVLSVFKRFEVIVWGLIVHALEIIPRLLSALDALGFLDLKQKITDALHRGGLEADDFVEKNAPTIRRLAEIFSAIEAWSGNRAALLMEIHEEGTRERAPGEEDIFTETQIADWLKRLLEIDDSVPAIKAMFLEAQPNMEIAAAAPLKRDVSKSPTLDA
ncbi:MAG: hypothetical protein ABFE13_11410 [Phycisphaerales bacterium]